jgi:hypothetical protein
MTARRNGARVFRAACRVALEMLWPREIPVSLRVEAGVFLGLCLLLLALFSFPGCAVPDLDRAQPLAELECLGSALAAGDASEDLLATVGPCGEVGL